MMLIDLQAPKHSIFALGAANREIGSRLLGKGDGRQRRGGRRLGSLGGIALLVATMKPHQWHGEQ